MTEIEQIKQALTEATPRPWIRMGSRIYPQDKNRYEKNEICWANSIPNAHLFDNAPIWLESLLTTIESQKEEIGRMGAVNQHLEIDLVESKAITELAVDALKDIEGYTASVSVGDKCRTALSEIEKLQK